MAEAKFVHGEHPRATGVDIKATGVLVGVIWRLGRRGSAKRSGIDSLQVGIGMKRHDLHFRALLFLYCIVAIR